MNPLVVIGLRVLAVVTVLVLAYQRGDHVGYARGHAELVVFKAEQTAKALAATTAARTEETRREVAQKDVTDETQRLAQLDRARRVAADARAGDADGRLQHSTAAVAALSCGTATDPAAASERQAGTAALVDVFGACRRALRQLGRDADDEVAELRRSGGECAGRYDALTPP